MKDVAICDPDVDCLGPAMLALTSPQRRFVVGWLSARGKNAARVAKASGYSDAGDGAKVAAHRLLHSPRVIAALKEEAERQFDGIAALAIVALRDQIGSKDPKVRQAAIDSALDRTGYGRKSVQDIRVEHSDTRTTAELLEFVRQMTGTAASVTIQGKAEVADG